MTAKPTRDPQLFVSTPSGHGEWISTEVTLLDLFAGFALTGILASSEESYGGYDDNGRLAREAYKAGEAMLTTRRMSTKRLHEEEPYDPNPVR